MKHITLLSITFFLLVGSCIFPVVEKASPASADIGAAGSAQIIGMSGIGQGRADKSGVAFTKSAVYLTGDGGETWSEAYSLNDSSKAIAQADFSDHRTGRILLADTQNLSLEIVETHDGGASWSSSPVAIDPAELQGTNLENARLAATSPGFVLTVPFETSSNFIGSITFESSDRLTWTASRREYGPNSSDEIQSAEKIAGLWTLRTGGECAGPKTGCVQVTRLFRAGNEITPPQVKELSRLEKESAARAAAPTFALAPGGTTRVSLNRGFDMCNAPTAAQMQTWWNNSPLYDMNIYMSGRNRACSAQPNLSAAWVNQVTAMGWGLIPTVVGYQSPCTASTTTAKLSFDPVVAESQGRGEADIAVTAATGLGLTAGSILYYDMERYDETGSTPGCRTATTAFLKGWTDRIKELGYKSGVYGSPKNAEEDWVTLPQASKMDAIWMARWDNIVSVWTYLSFPTFPANEWTTHQRIKQWQAPHNETWGGVTFNIDGNISDAPVAGLAIAKNKNADFDGDGRSDISVFRPDTGIWYVFNSATSVYSALPFGVATDVITPGDYDGDGKTDYSLFRPSDGTWHVLAKANFYSARAFGQSGDIPVTGDYNGDGKTDIALFRPSNGTWYISNSDSLGTYSYYGFGQAGDKPVPGDFDGDGKTDVAVYRPSSGIWYVWRSSDGVITADLFGLSGDRPVQGDYDGDGKCDEAVFRDGAWYLNQTTGGFTAFPFGTAGDIPASGDYDGDGKMDAAIFRPSDGIWYMVRSQSGFFAMPFGLAGDRPVESGYFPQ